ncbi:MAG: DinB family protein [Chloroflexota bacterium]
MDPNRKLWNEQQQALRKALYHPEEHQKAITLFLSQHAMVHASTTSGDGLWSVEDEVWQGLTDRAARCVPLKFEHSIVWCLWHLTRCEDITMNMLVAGTSQLLLEDGWLERMKVPDRDTGNAMKPKEIADFSAQIDIHALRAYRQAVGRRTGEIVKSLKPGAVKYKVNPVRLQRVREDGVVLASEQWLLDYWGGQTIAGLLLMPPTRHSMVHLNEAGRIKQKRC